MAVFRIEKIKDYTIMSNHHLRNKSLSLKAKGLQSLMLSLPESWDFTLAGLAYICQDGIGSVRSGVAENTTEVRNIRSYLLTTLYNAPGTIGSYYKQMVQHDMYGSN